MSSESEVDKTSAGGATCLIECALSLGAQEKELAQMIVEAIRDARLDRLDSLLKQSSRKTVNSLGILRREGRECTVSPLEAACRCDFPEAIPRLFAAGACADSMALSETDTPGSIPSNASLGDALLLHCIQKDYVQCLEALLASIAINDRMRPVSKSTADISRVRYMQ